ncbi:RIR1 reductase, partial [Upupa epops]|nr:RIR1 reductase [Upupa epops]
QVVNPHLLKDLTERGLWNEEMKNHIIAHNGSIQVLRRRGRRRRRRKRLRLRPARIPSPRGWGRPRRVSSPRGPAASPAPRALPPQGLKTGMYYLRTKPAANPIQFTLNKEKLREREKPSKEEEEKERNKAAMVCSLENRDECLMCGS